jgi:hypothetical protein
MLSWSVDFIVCRTRACRHSGVSPVARRLLQIDGLKLAGLVQLRPRHLMRTLVVVWTEGDRRAQSQVEIMHSLKFLDEFFCVYIAADPPDSLSECGLHANLHLPAKFPGCATERRGHSEQDLAVADALNSRILPICSPRRCYARRRKLVEG